MSAGKRADEVAPKKVEWLWMDRIPKSMITVVAGKADQGKGLFAARVAADVSRRGGNVLYSAVEDDHGMMTRPRLEAAGADLKRVVLWRFGVPEQINELRDIVMRGNVDLVVMDPFNAHLTGGVSRFSDSIRKVTNPLSEIAEQSGASILVTEHALKKVAKDAHPLNAIGGSGSGLPAASRMGYLFGVDPDDEERRILASVKSNLREAPAPLAFETDTEEFPIVGEVPALLVTGEVTFDARRLLTITGDGKPGRKPDKRASCAEWLTTHMAITLGAVPVKAGTIVEDAKQFGFTHKTLRRAAEDMGVVKDPPGGGRNCTWDLPPEVKKAMGVEGKKEAKS